MVSMQDLLQYVLLDKFLKQTVLFFRTDLHSQKAQFT